jgi:hypothetical protein
VREFFGKAAGCRVEPYIRQKTRVLLVVSPGEMMVGEYLLDKYRGSPVCRPERRLLAYRPRTVDANQLLDRPVAGKDRLDCSPRVLARGSSEDWSQRDRILDGFLVPESPNLGLSSEISPASPFE